MRRVMGVVLLAAALAACGDPFGPGGGGGVEVMLEDGGLRVTNARSEPLYYAAIGDNALILFAPCVRPDCPRVAAGGTVRIPLAEIPAGAESQVISVHWWRAETEGGQRVPGPVHTIRVQR